MIYFFKYLTIIAARCALVALIFGAISVSDTPEIILFSTAQLMADKAKLEIFSLSLNFSRVSVV